VVNRTTFLREFVRPFVQRRFRQVFMHQQDTNTPPPRRVGLLQRYVVSVPDGVACALLCFEIQVVAAIDHDRADTALDRVRETVKVPLPRNRKTTFSGNAGRVNHRSGGSAARAAVRFHGVYDINRKNSNARSDTSKLNSTDAPYPRGSVGAACPACCP
jgi:hypothetical protein